MPLPKEQIDAMRGCLQILSPLHTPTMRQKMALNTESFIQKGKWFEAFELEHIPILFYPADIAKATAMRDAMESAYQNGELPGLKQHKRRFLPSHLAAWPDCPPVPANSPLRFWLPASMQVKPALSPNVSIPYGLKTIVLPSGTTHVPFNEVAHLIAYAIHPDIDEEDDNPSSYHFALIGLETELKNATKFGQLPVKNKLTLGAHELPIGDALNHVLVTVDDLRSFVADRGIKVAVSATEPQATELKPKPRISRAPTPITPLNALSHIQAIPIVVQPPKWDKWRHMRDVEIWEAVALSLNFDPDKLPVYLGAYDKLGDDPFRICSPQFLERLLVANSNCGISFGFKHVHDLKARCLVDLPEFVAWAVKRNITDMPLEFVAIAATEPQAAPATSTATPAPLDDESHVDSWKDKARVRAAEIIERQRAKDLYPSRIDIAEEIAKEFRKEGIFGVSGKPLTGETIKRHALKGISSASVKQLSTSNTSGKRGKNK